MELLERRSFRGDCEIRTAANGSPIIAGYAVVFNRFSQNLGGFIERVHPRAADKTVKEADVRALANHDANWLLGRTSSKTLRLGIDSVGVEYEIDVNVKDPDGVRALEKVDRGDWDGSSFSFVTLRDDWNLDARPAERTLLEFSLRDVGPVTFPAYLDTTTVAQGVAGRIAQLVGVEARAVAEALAAGDLSALTTQNDPALVPSKFGTRMEALARHFVAERADIDSIQCLVNMYQLGQCFLLDEEFDEYVNGDESGDDLARERELMTQIFANLDLLIQGEAVETNSVSELDAEVAERLMSLRARRYHPALLNA